MVSSKRTVAQPQSKSRLLLILQTTLVYFLLSASLVLFVFNFVPQLFDAQGKPTIWLQIIQIDYYFFPLILAILFGIFFQPFWKNSVRLFLFIIAVQFAISLAFYGLRVEYLKRQQDSVSQGFLANVQFSRFSHKFFDTNHDGFIDKVEFYGQCRIENFPEGEYILAAAVHQQGQVLLPDPQIALRQQIKEPATRIFNLQFAINPQGYSQYYVKGNLDIFLSIKRVVAVDPLGERISLLNRWIPFLRTVPWDGGQGGQEYTVDLSLSRKVDSFRLLPIPN